MTYIYRNESGAMIFSRSQLRHKTGLVYTPRGGKRKKNVCDGLPPHTFNGQCCNACRSAMTATERLAVTVGEFIAAVKDWIEFRFGDR